jgi:hypothetical protein
MPDPFFEPRERRMLEKLADYLLPGAAELGVADYIENLFNAFEVDPQQPPRIYAGGPFSGRMPKVANGQPTGEFPKNAFLEFLPLTRVQEAAWRARLYGTDRAREKLPNAQFARGFDGYRRILGQGVMQALRLQSERRMPPAAVDLFMAMDADARRLLEELTIEAAFSAPEYGGNPIVNGQPAGWARIGYAGDSLPRGYSLYDPATKTYHELPDAPMSGPEPGDDLHPIGALARLFLSLNTLFNEGKVFK